MRIYTRKPKDVPRKISILLVDDNPAILAYVRDLVKDTEFALWEASDCGTALKYLQSDGLAVDILLSEIVVGIPCGWNLAVQVPSLRPQAKVILMSSSYLDALQGHGPYLNQGLYLWGVQFLPKPFTRESLLFRLRETWAHGTSVRLETASGLGRLGSKGFEAADCC